MARPTGQLIIVDVQYIFVKGLAHKFLEDLSASKVLQNQTFERLKFTLLEQGRVLSEVFAQIAIVLPLASLVNSHFIV